MRGQFAAFLILVGLGAGSATAQNAFWRGPGGPRVETLSNRIDGFTAYRAGNFATAVRLLKPFALAGDTEAANALGTILRGFGEMGLSREAVAKDPAQAMLWFKRAALAGEPEAMEAFAQMTEHGEAAAPDLVAAYNYYGAAANAFPPGPEQSRSLAEGARVQAQIEIVIARGAAGDADIQRLAAEWRGAQSAGRSLEPAGLTGAQKPAPGP